jgi:hypothetical protein
MRIPGYPVIRDVIWYVTRRKPVPERLRYRLAVLCLCRLKGRHPLFTRCEDCFFYDVCAYPKNPEWFMRRGIVAEKEGGEEKHGKAARG